MIRVCCMSCLPLKPSQIKTNGDYHHWKPFKKQTWEWQIWLITSPWWLLVCTQRRKIPFCITSITPNYKDPIMNQPYDQISWGSNHGGLVSPSLRPPPWPSFWDEGSTFSNLLVAQDIMPSEKGYLTQCHGWAGPCVQPMHSLKLTVNRECTSKDGGP